MNDEDFKNTINDLINKILKRLEEIDKDEISIINKLYNYDIFNAMVKNDIEENDRITHYYNTAYSKDYTFPSPRQD